MKKFIILIFSFAIIFYIFNNSLLVEDVNAFYEENPVTEVSSKIFSANVGYDDEEEIDEEDKPQKLDKAFIKDSIPSFNKKIFKFNDIVYFKFVKPFSNGYRTIVPEKGQVGVRNFFTNIKTPIRFFNCLFQGKFLGAGSEFLRLIINSTVGVAGFSDVAKESFKLEKQDEDFGQTLGRYNCGAGTYIVIPFLGPSNVRDSIGSVVDFALNPITFLGFFVSPYASTGANTYNKLNDFSIDIIKKKDYEKLIERRIDPYIRVQRVYTIDRIIKIKK
ncbi:MAG: VacJ family lipoprotein [Arcobacter sp.]|nr:VacJ family lipoprotein [Arcobacter sp.]